MEPQRPFAASYSGGAREVRTHGTVLAPTERERPWGFGLLPAIARSVTPPNVQQMKLTRVATQWRFRQEKSRPAGRAFYD